MAPLRSENFFNNQPESFKLHILYQRNFNKNNAYIGEKYQSRIFLISLFSKVQGIRSQESRFSISFENLTKHVRSKISRGEMQYSRIPTSRFPMAALSSALLLRRCPETQEVPHYTPQRFSANKISRRMSCVV